MESKNPAVEVADYGACDIGESAYNDLFPISGQSIVSLCKKNTGLLVFPNSLGDYNDAIDEDHKSICSITSGSYAEGEWELHAGGILGFVGSGETELTIHSRFAPNDENDFFLHYMVQKVFNINLFDLKHSTSEDRVFDFLLCLFPKYLKGALRQGLYKQYVVNKYNDSNVRGMIDVARHIKKNVPFTGKIAYNVREYSYDNNITQLIRHTIEHIRSSRMSGILKQDDDTETYVSQICAATPSYKSQNRSRVVSKNLKAPTSPFYLGYIPLQKLCIQILTHKKLKYGNDNDRQIYGLLFVGSWLWEEYLAGILRECGFTHAENKKQTGEMYLFSNNKYPRYPDYYKRNNDSDKSFVLDAKYKHLEDGKIDRNDMHQVISYMHVLPAKSGGFINPYSDSDNPNVDLFPIGELNGYGGEMFVISVPIPSNVQNYDEFQGKMKNAETTLIKTINDLG